MTDEKYTEHDIAGAAYVAYYVAMGLPSEWSASNWAAMVEFRPDVAAMWNAAAEAACAAKQAVLAAQAV
jgi:hypothetical protein